LAISKHKGTKKTKVLFAIFVPLCLPVADRVQKNKSKKYLSNLCPFVFQKNAKTKASSLFLCVSKNAKTKAIFVFFVFFASLMFQKKSI
jgi:hypothetical protein